MNFDVYFPFKNKEGKLCPGIKPKPMEWEKIREMISSPQQSLLIGKVRAAEGDERAEAKKELPAICWVGTCSKTRAIANMKPTGFVMIDIDHVPSPSTAWQVLQDERPPLNLPHKGETYDDEIALVHITPSGHGLRIVFRARKEFRTLEENMEWLCREWNLHRFGDVDMACKDYARLSFLPFINDVLYENEGLLVGQAFGEDEMPLENGSLSLALPSRGGDDGLPDFTEQEITEFEGYDYRGTLVKTIIDKWVEVQGTPGRGEIHNYYNDMVKNFRNIVSNNKRALLYLLPRFGHTAEECWSSIKSICKVNTLSSLPKPFYFFLKDNGFWKKNVEVHGSLAEYMMSENTDTDEAKMPWIPPVFREFVKIAPKDFRPSMVNCLLPVMGTLASYLQAPYYYDGRMHTSSFFSIVYAPAGTGKGFAERLMDALFGQLKLRDYIQQVRENIYLRELQRKGANDKAPADPHTTLRIIPPKNSEAEFLQKMQDNCGYHMFTFAAEMDSWAKGVRAAGGNKDDMIRIAWDNGEYGQQFKSANTFKGTVRLYWNVLITGTVQQLMSYFKNVENGLITRCSFTTIDNQEFAAAPVWKTFTKKDNEVLRKFMERCDRNSYEQPCELLPEDINTVPADKFDDEVNWRFAYRQRQTVSMDWLRPTIEGFLERHRKKAAIDYDRARDVFRRRAAVRGFRLGLLCHALWDKPRESDLKKCIPFIEWWMEQDIESSLKLWGVRYNNETEQGPQLRNKSLYNELGDTFTKEDVYAQCVRLGIKSPVRSIVHGWVAIKAARKVDKNKWQKIKKQYNESE